jgi:hypothetical protein
MNYEDKIKTLEEELEKTKQELIQTKEHLKKYTAPIRYKTYYENHKQELLEKMKSNPISTDKRKEYNKKYYLKKKENNSENI